ncbi:unnamed protein product [Spirodela intermedia]|uniref:Protein kinase domain-containing protein n=1 Tax=Spirodela intermedia TaxID=51605 RepID=A0A7I8IBP6_SPIIN|nr:unnamed protein product [Spirodela intermedia]CAA6654764.1 unnamed protein product [Spirodela intermedia]
MFVTSVQAEEKFITENGLPSGTNLETSPSDCSKAYGASVTECEKQIQKSNYTVQVKGSNLFLQKIQSSVPSSSCSIGERELPLNLLDDHKNGLESGLSCGNFQSSEQHEAAEHLEPHILEKERDTLSSFDLPKSPNRDFAGGKVDCGIRKELQLCDLDEEYEVFDLRIIHKKNRFPIAMNSIIAGRYCVTEHLAHDLLTGMDVCLKIIKNDKDFFDQSLDEIKLLKLVNKHDPADEHHILRLYDYFYYQEHLFIVCELLRANLYEFQKLNEESGGEIYFTLSRIQKIARQCLEGLEFLHSLSIIHCDLKPENILIKSYRRCKIKIIDLGSSCFRTDNLCLYVQSRSYRAPEVILGLPYDEKIDIWSLGCVLAELFTGEETHKYFTDDRVLYRKNEETDRVERITPGRSTLSSHLGSSDLPFIGFLGYLLQMNPQKRPTAEQALQHPWLSHL